MKVIIYFLITINIFSFSLGNFAIEPKLGARIFFQVDSSQINLESARFYNIEAYYRINKAIDIGIGSGFEVVEANYILLNPTSNRGSIKNIPLYISTKYYLGEDNDIAFYTKGTLGYSFLYTSEINNINNSHFYSIGLGLEMDSFIAEINMQVNNQISKEDLFYGAISYDFIVGYRF